MKRSLKNVCIMLVIETTLLAIAGQIKWKLLTIAEKAGATGAHNQYMTAHIFNHITAIIICIIVGVGAIIIFKVCPLLKYSSNHIRVAYIALLFYTVFMMFYPILAIHVGNIYILFAGTYLAIFRTQTALMYLFGVLFAAMILPNFTVRWNKNTN